MSIILYKNNNKILDIFTDFDNILDELYEQKLSVPTEKQLTDYIKNGNNKEIIIFIKKYGISESILKIKKQLSKNKSKIPLYDIYSKNLYLIIKENIYNRVVYYHYRFPDSQLLEYFKSKKTKIKIQLEKNNNDVLLNRENRKLSLMISFLEQFDLGILEKTYMILFYSYSNEVGKNITLCTRPSFMNHLYHINPYYTRSELINMGLNLELIKFDNLYYDKEKIKSLCNTIKENDISSDIILNHQHYITNSNGIGLVQYYSLQGSFFINQYLRGFTNYVYKNKSLEVIIKNLWKLVLDAPEFDKSYILYRFIKQDDHIKHLRIGDIYTEKSFISMTRNPFYRSDTYKFGFVLIKIKIPKNTKGIGLCVETFSHFPYEQEIILPPLSQLKLVKKDKNTPYYHTDKVEESKIETRYEFVYIGNLGINIEHRPQLDKLYDIVDFMKIEDNTYITLNEKISSFISKYIDPLYQFKTLIGDKIYTIILEWYDSTDAYKDYYAVRTDNGFSMYTIIDNYVSFVIELGENNYGSFMYVNYYFRYSLMSKKSAIDTKYFIDFLSKISYHFKIKNVILYSDYFQCDNKFSNETEIDNVYKHGNYILDYYVYLKYNKKKYNEFDTLEIKPKFSYYDLDRLKSTSPSIILKKTDRDELYQLYIKAFKNSEYKDNMADFFIWLTENYCIFMKYFIMRMERVYSRNNPFKLDYYILDGYLYLYNRKIIDTYITTSLSQQSINDNNVYDINIPKNNYRLDYNRIRTR
jgi:hypothetical protein